MKRTCLLVATVNLFIWNSVFGVGGDMGVSTEPQTDGSANHPYLIEDLADFDTFANATNAATFWATGVHTKLTVDLDLSGRTYTTAVIAPDTDGSNSPPDYDGTPFVGSFNGNGYVIKNLTIDGGAINDYIGLFGQIGSGGEVYGVEIENCDVTGQDYYTASLVGQNFIGTITACYSTGVVDSFGYYTGGLVGENVGGITKCYSTTAVTGGNYVGCLVGINAGSITNCYSTGAVTGESIAGGLVGYDYSSITNCYSTGGVKGSIYVGGFVGLNDLGTSTSCFWDVNTSSIGISGDDNYGAIGKTTDEMHTQSTFTDVGWDFIGETLNGTVDVWYMPTNDYPKLAWEMDDNSVISDHVHKIEISTTTFYHVSNSYVPYYGFDAGILVDETVTSGTVQIPTGDIYPLILEEDEPERWFSFYAEGAELADLLAGGFTSGIYTFTVNYSDGGSDSTSVNYALPSGDPIPYVDQKPSFLYPLHNDTDIPLSIALLFEPALNPDWTISLDWEPEPEEDDGLVGEVEFLPYDTTSYGPVILSPNQKYEFEIGFNHVVDTVNADGIWAVMDTDNEFDIHATTTSDTIQNPITLLEELIQQVIDLDLHHGTENSLLAKLNSAINALDNGNEKIIINSLEAFIHAVSAQSGKKIAEEEADELIASAQYIIGVLNNG